MSIMSQICFLVAVLMMCSVSGRGIDNLGEEASRERAIDERTDSEQGQEVVVCGQKQIQTSKRNEETGGLNNHDDSDHLDKVFGGSDVTYGEVPWQANVYDNGHHLCGGAIVNEYWVLTSASCMYNREGRYPSLVVGDHRLFQSDAGQQSFEVTTIIPHGLYNENKIDYDIALLKVEPKNGSGILFNNYVQPICLPAPGENPTADDRLTVSGWGYNIIDNDFTVLYLEELNNPTDVLQKVDLTVMDQQGCRDAEDITESVLCTQRISPNSGVCLTDYGGPATYQIGESQVLAGIIAFSALCLSPNSPVFLTNVLTHRDWINQIIHVYSNITERIIPSRSG